MLPLTAPNAQTGHEDDLSSVGNSPELAPLLASLGEWDLSSWRPPTGPEVAEGAAWNLLAGDVVSSAPELARLTLNLAHVHHDRFSQPSGRLVYGGHTIGLAMAQMTRTLPHLLTIAGWHGCDHTGPVREGDTLTSRVEVTSLSEASSAGVRLADMRVVVSARDEAGAREVLDWRPIVILR